MSMQATFHNTAPSLRANANEHPQPAHPTLQGLGTHTHLIAKKYLGDLHVSPLSQHDLNQILHHVPNEQLGFASLALYNPESNDSQPKPAALDTLQNIGLNSMQALLSGTGTAPVSVLWALSRDNSNPTLLSQSARYLEYTKSKQLFAHAIYWNPTTRSFSPCHPIGLATAAVEADPSNTDNWLTLSETLSESDAVLVRIGRQTFDITKKKCLEQIERLREDYRNVMPVPSPEPELLRQLSPVQSLVKQIESDPSNIDLWRSLSESIASAMVVIQLEGDHVFADAAFCQQTLDMLENEFR